MAIVVPMRKKYKPRNIVESVVDNVLRLRSNCRTMSNPRTQAQQYVRSRFQLMHGLQKELAPILKRGFDRRLNARERWVGAYHVALGYNMTEAARYNSALEQWQCDFSRFSICEHKSRAPKRITVQRKGSLLILSYHWKGQAERTSLLWAVYNTTRGRWVHGIHDTHLHGKATACAIPPAWREEPVQVFIGFGRDAQGRGKLRGTHHFSFVKSEGLVTVRGASPSVSSTVGTVSTWHVLLPPSLPRVELVYNQGVTLRIEVLYLVE